MLDPTDSTVSQKIARNEYEHNIHVMMVQSLVEHERERCTQEKRWSGED